MRKTLLLAAALVAGHTAAAEARIRYQGVFHIFANTGCNGNYVGRTFRAGYLPAGLSDNGSETTLSLFDTRSARNFKLSGSMTTAPKPAQATEIFNFTSSIDNTPTLRFLTSRSFAAAPTFVTVEGEIAGFDWQPTCRISYRLGLIKRPDS
jgi:hypothetical protein